VSIRLLRDVRALPCEFVAGVALLFASAPPVRAQAPEVAPATACARIWLGHESEYEALLRTAEVTKVERLSIGVTNPRCAFVSPGLPFRRMAWKTLRPGTYHGFYESYRSEIAAYELDKLIGLGMVPPSVERRIRGEVGAAILWVENVRSWDVRANIRGPDKRAWARQLVRTKMFDQLCGNIDRNQGNLLYDSDYDIILIDHSRAFRDELDLNRFQKFLFVDEALWRRIEALTMETLEPALGEWVSKGMLYAVLQRRDRMKKEVERLLAARGPSIWLAGP
jgi:hypothetical protein